MPACEAAVGCNPCCCCENMREKCAVAGDRHASNVHKCFRRTPRHVRRPCQNPPQTKLETNQGKGSLGKPVAESLPPRKGSVAVKSLPRLA